MLSHGKTVLCIFRNTILLSISALQANGYKVLMANNGREGLMLFMSQEVDVIVLEYYLELLDGGVVAQEVKRVRPEVPIVMLADQLELPMSMRGVLDALVDKSDGAEFLLATLKRVLNPCQMQLQFNMQLSHSVPDAPKRPPGRVPANRNQANSARGAR
jgi:DNA-binding response OmpR family regulator